MRVWGKRPTADRRSWAGNTIRVWGKRLDFGVTPQQVLADRYGAAPKRSIDGDAGWSPAGDSGGTAFTRRLLLSSSLSSSSSSLRTVVLVPQTLTRLSLRTENILATT